MRRVSIEEIKPLLLKVERPGRYVGGEYGIAKQKEEAILHVALSYPDLYEIGMSNLAVQILYNRLNKINGVSCERVFAPAWDFEEVLRSKAIPLFSLETGCVLSDFDIIGFSIGYELTLTNLLNILDLADIPLLAKNRTEKDPIVIAGGPAVTNPAPFGKFLDAVMIGEAEGVLDKIMVELLSLKRKGAGREDLISHIIKNESIWSLIKEGQTTRAIWHRFGIEENDESYRIVPNIKTVQDHGVVEIMRGCPNGCRFCHAGMFYRPCREKDLNLIIKEVDFLIGKYGYREITLSSLSSGDFTEIEQLTRVLNSRYSAYGVSFALPSLRIDSFTLSLLKELSVIRKSGLTFAVETPNERWQKGLNKEVSLDKTLKILKKAREMGWRQAKFYFMIGLPVVEPDEEVSQIVDFIKEVQNSIKIKLHINLGTFIPKPHTPFQWAQQLSLIRSEEKLKKIKSIVRNRYTKVNYHSPMLSMLEGAVSRGDHRIGELFLSAFYKGARLDSWEEHFNRKVWDRVIKEASWNVEHESCRERKFNEILPWDGIDLGISKTFLQKEYLRAMEAKKSPLCEDPCNYFCGVCRNGLSVRRSDTKIEDRGLPLKLSRTDNLLKVIFSFEKKDRAIYISHLNLMTVIERALLRAGFFVRHTEGFNPKPKIEFANALPLGIGSEEEIASVEVYNLNSTTEFIEKVNRVLPEGVRVKQAKIRSIDESKKRKESLMSNYWGSEFEILPLEGSSVLMIKEKLIGKAESNSLTHEEIDIRLPPQKNGLILRLKDMGKKSLKILPLLSEAMGTLQPFDRFNIKRIHTFAKDKSGKPESYFSI